MNMDDDLYFYKTRNWSIGGFCIDNLEGVDGFEAGNIIPVRVDIPFSDFDINFETEVKIVRIDKSLNSLSAKFISLDNRKEELLKYFADALISGEIAGIGDTLKHIDTPVTLVSEKPDSKKNERQPEKKRKAILIASSYIAAGVLIGSYVLGIAYSSIFKIRVQSAAISAPDNLIRAPFSGTIDLTYVTVGDAVQLDEPLFYIRDDATIESIEMAKIVVRDAENELMENEQKLSAEYQMLEIYRSFGVAELKIAEAETKALKEKLALAKTRYERNLKLHQKDLASDDVVDRVAEEYIGLRASLSVAMANEEMARKAVEQIDSGWFYTDNKLEGKVGELKPAVTAAKERLLLEKERLSLMEKRRLRLEIQSPVDGRIVSVLSGTKQFVEKGQPLAVIEGNGKKLIEAFVSADNLKKIDLSRPATIFLQGSSTSLSATVDSIERGLIPESSLRNVNSVLPESAVAVKVNLILHSKNPNKKLDNLPPGLPVTVEFSRIFDANIIKGSAEFNSGDNDDANFSESIPKLDFPAMTKAE
ncbi:hypothetical protein GCM10027217_10910 [Pseudomaricurvus hydrocarbonicus]